MLNRDELLSPTPVTYAGKVDGVWRVMTRDELLWRTPVTYAGKVDGVWRVTCATCEVRGVWEPIEVLSEAAVDRWIDEHRGWHDTAPVPGDR